MNLFKKIFLKHLHKGQEPISKLVDDVGPLSGIINVKGHDIRTGKIIHNEIQDNLLVNLSKSNVIRLIGQETSPWLGAMTSSDQKITRMRFGNNDGVAAAATNYYDINEPSYRENNPSLGGNVTSNFPGGKNTGSTTSKIASEALSDIDTSYAVAGNYTAGPNSTKIFTVSSGSGTSYPSDSRPPAHGSFTVKLHTGDPTTTGVLEETIVFAATNVQYTRVSTGNPPSKITTVSATEFISTPITRPDSPNYSYDDPITGTKLYYDYTTGSSGWKFMLEETAASLAAGDYYNYIQQEFQKGTYNVINSIVPRDGYNSGAGTTISTRYTDNTAGDYYPILAGVEYRDSADADVDDVSVTFSASMPGSYGNGETSGTSDSIHYEEAFLFNDNDDLFSMIALNTPFSKDENSAFFISWTIAANV